MAQLAIPLLALGGLYVIAKQSEEDSELDSKEKKKDLEGFSNYPVVPEVKENGVNDYSSSNQTTDKFFKNPVSQEKVSKETHKQLSVQSLARDLFSAAGATQAVPRSPAAA